ncbi:unnamed protein product [Porites lobata]|uniref:C2H2-type domain-containing protein n=1 Tax=Porites lobata TaxID=104759 RepID=A0ABN8MPE3_9CNID|nr:unnamed protein product [Porites lobata]
MAHCSYKALLGKVTPSQGTPCGQSADYPGQLECIALKDCIKDVTGHLKTLNLSADEGLGSEINLLLARAGVFSVEEHHYALSICPRHRADFGIRWRTGKTMCTVPKELAVHKTTTAKGSHRVDSLKSAFIFKATNTLIPVGSPICKQCNECISKLAMPNQTLVFASGGVEPVPGVSLLQELPEPHLLVEGETGRSSAETTSGELSSDDLATELKRLEISSRGRDDETFLSPDTGSLVSSTSDEAPPLCKNLAKKNLVHVCSSSEIASHCSVFALSDSTIPDLQQQCSHKHEECCEQCEILHSTLQNISSAVERASFATQDDKEEALFLVNSSVLAIQSWKCPRYQVLQKSFSEGDFTSFRCKSEKQVGQTASTSATVAEPSGGVLEDSDLSTGVYSCPQDGCVRVFQRVSALEKHLSVEKCSRSRGEIFSNGFSKNGIQDPFGRRCWHIALS